MDCPDALINLSVLVERNVTSDLTPNYVELIVGISRIVAAKPLESLWGVFLALGISSCGGHGWQE